MATKQETQEISELKTEVALLNQFNTEVVKPTLEKIEKTLASMSFVTRAEFKEYKASRDEISEDIYRAINKKNWKERALTVAFTSIMTSVLLAFVNS